MTKVKESGKLIKLPQARMSDLYVFLSSFPPNDLGSIGAARKIFGALAQLEEVGKGYIQKIENIRVKIMKTFEPYQEQIAALNQKIGACENKDEQHKLEAEKSSVEFEANKKAGPDNIELTALLEGEGMQKVEAELDPNYFAQVQELVKKEGMKKFNQVKAFLEICDALEIQE